ncbi:hypothetical protein F53441_11515 [Fusarium austroafricanum]|uniref:Cyanovirin-N domain-containing protein n=1 Tax=Fusarium austroafricanum TaxID=2364996 RepID=A0A8H4NT05_9HYPO|nr:hypothetical protein F53441_11515 [Fusarium austroafricanum]
MRSTSLLTLAAATTGISAQYVSVKGWINLNCDGRAFSSANVGTGCVNIEKFPLTNINITVMNGCADGKVPIVKVSENDCANFETIDTLKGDVSCKSVGYAPQAFIASCN